MGTIRVINGSRVPGKASYQEYLAGKLIATGKPVFQGKESLPYKLVGKL